MKPGIGNIIQYKVNLYNFIVPARDSSHTVRKLCLEIFEPNAVKGKEIPGIMQIKEGHYLLMERLMGESDWKLDLANINHFKDTSVEELENLAKASVGPKSRFINYFG